MKDFLKKLIQRKKDEQTKLYERMKAKILKKFVLLVKH